MNRQEERQQQVVRPRPRKAQQGGGGEAVSGGGSSGRGRRTDTGRRCPDSSPMSKSPSSVHLGPGGRPRSTSLTRSQSARLGPGRGGGQKFFFATAVAKVLLVEEIRNMICEMYVRI